MCTEKPKITVDRRRETYARYTQLPCEVVRDENEISATETRGVDYSVLTCIQTRLLVFRKSIFRKLLGTQAIESGV